jgi:hypothetical protein
MNVWEYHVEEVSDNRIEGRLNMLGAEGWELVSAASLIGEKRLVDWKLILKRPKSPSKAVGIPTQPNTGIRPG